MDRETGEARGQRDTDRRIESLEMQAGYQERALSDLSAAVYDQERRIGRLEELVKSMAEKLKEMAGDGMPLPPGERPPHY